MTTQSADDGPISVDEAVDLLSPDEGEETETTEEEDSDADSESETSEGVEASDEGEDTDDEDEGADEPAIEAPPAPASWNKEAAKVWAKLDPEARAIIAEREADRDRATAEAAQRAGQLGAQLKPIVEKFNQWAPQLEDGFRARWGNVDWVGLAQEVSAEEYNSIRAQMDAEKEQLDAFRGETERASQIAYAHFLQEEAPKLERLAPEIATPGEQRTKLVKFLVDAGFDSAQLRFASAAELSIAYDAMRYREARANAKLKAAEPKKQPVAPRAVKAAPAGAAKSQDMEVQKLRARVTKTRSIDDALDFLDARAKKVARKR